MVVTDKVEVGRFSSRKAPVLVLWENSPAWTTAGIETLKKRRSSSHEDV